LVDGRDLIIGGVKIPYEKGLLGHSDADVLAHAIMDSILGALALGDIGKLFPDSDKSFKGADSLLLMASLLPLLDKADMRISNIDSTVIAEAPKLSPYIEEMRRNIASVLKIPTESVSVKATTEEGLGFSGSGLGIAAHAVCLLENK
jgi:2-C-methyl-D-erythritol 2,4-cyclodiphosphate synthase